MEDGTNAQRKRIRKLENGASSVQDALTLELIGVCRLIAQAYGVAGSRFDRLTRASSSATLPSPVSSVLLRDAHSLAAMLTAWEEEPGYLDGTGRPASLKVYGKRGTFESLSSRFFPRKRIDEVLKLACTVNAVERLPQGRIARINNCVLFTGDSFLMFAHTIRALKWFLGTAKVNSRASAKTSLSIPDRAAHVSVSKQDFEEFVRFMRPQISDFVELANRWLQKRSAARARTGRKHVAGVHAFLFQE